MPPDPDVESDDEEDEDETEKVKNDFMNLWAMAVRNGVADSEWQNLTIPKIRSLGKANSKDVEFQIKIHGGEIKNKKPKKVKFLSDLGFFPK